MFPLQDIRKSRVWQEAREEGLEEGLEKGRMEGRLEEKQATIRRWLSKGKSLQEIAELLEIPLAEVRRLGKR